MSSQNGSKPSSFEVRIMRQDGPGEPSYWERHRVTYEPNLNVISVLQKIAALATTSDGKSTTPVAWDCNCLEEVCGACTMVINGKARQSCSALVDRLLEEDPTGFELRPMVKFPVMRDLVVDRSRMFRTLERIKGWIPVDGYGDRGAGPKESQASQEMRYPISECMTCGCCLDACPQFGKIEVTKHFDETDAEYEARKNAAYDEGFVGANAIAQTMLFNAHPTGEMSAHERLDALKSPGGLQVCGNAQNCVAVCPKSIPLTREIARAGRQLTSYMFKRWFDR